MNANSQSGQPAPQAVVSTIVLPQHAIAAKMARQFVQENRDHLRPDLVEETQLLVTEIVANAVRYGRPDITLRMRVHPPGVGIEVSDTGDTLPASPSIPPATQLSGRGLLIVDAIATAWGVNPNQPPPGKTVWFELHPT